MAGPLPRKTLSHVERTLFLGGGDVLHKVCLIIFTGFVSQTNEFVKYPTQASKFDYRHTSLNGRDEQIEAMDQMKDMVNAIGFSGL